MGRGSNPGLLFGFPQGAAAKQSDELKKQPTPASDPPKPSTNLVAESAATLGKVLTGFTLAKAGQLELHFWKLCTEIAPALAPPMLVMSWQGIIAYFLATGFLSGLLLPSYFMTGKWS